MNPVNIGSRREVFWDYALIERSRTTAQLKLHHPREEEVVLSHNEPWEGDGCNSYSIIQDGDRYRLYYSGWEMMNKDCTKHAKTGIVYCYAESSDGIHWVKPGLGLFAFNGSKENNIVMNQETFNYLNLMHFFIDENPACPQAEKYKAVGADTDQGLSCWVSADGIHFEKGWQMTKNGAFDSHNIVFWSPEFGCYFGYIRDFHNRSLEAVGDSAVRDVRWMTSPDCRNWTAPEMLDFGGAEDYPLYTSEVQRYPRAPHMFIGFPSRYTERKVWTDNVQQLPNPERRKALFDVHPRYGLAATDCLFMTSRDGKKFHRFDEAWLRPGIERRFNWVYGDCYPATGLVETQSRLQDAPKEYSIYCYEKHWSGDGTDLYRYTIRKDGFCSMSSGYGESKIYTRPFIFKGNKMELNFATSARGYVYIKLRYLNQEIASCELFGDSLDRIVPFDGDLSQFSDKEVTMEITLRDADIFSFRFFEEA